MIDIGVPESMCEVWPPCYLGQLWQHYPLSSNSDSNSSQYITKRTFMQTHCKCARPSVHLGIHSVTCNPHT
jgi:hypothetical protein